MALSNGFRKHGETLVLIFSAVLFQPVPVQTAQGELTIGPSENIKLSQRVDYYIGDVVATCDGTKNTNPLTDLRLSTNATGKEEEEMLQNRPPTVKKEAKMDNFEGHLDKKILKYKFSDPNCNHKGTYFTCRIQAAGDTEELEITKRLNLEVADGDITIVPGPADTNILRTVGDKLVIICSAIVGGVESTDKSNVQWEWTKKDQGEADFSKLEDSVAEGIESLDLMLKPCNGANSTSLLRLTLQPQDDRRLYKCSYKNVAAGDKVFNKGTSTHVGQVKSLSAAGGGEKATVYSKESLIGMILGISSFVCVSCLGTFYVYRKKRTGKKYDIVTALLNQEEQELDKIEARLGTAAAVGGVSAAGEESSASAPEESSTTAPEETSTAAEESSNA